KRNPELGKRCRDQAIAAHEAGELKYFYGPGLPFIFADDEATVHAIRVAADASIAADLTRAEMQGRADAWTLFERWKKNVPGFEEAYFITSGPFIGVRETRRLVGEHVLTEDDIVTNRNFDDAVATGCWYLDRHPNKATVGTANDRPPVQPDPYDIPYRSLLPKKISNLLVAGRCHSASREASTSTRVTATAMALGEAAGTAAALAIAARKSTSELGGLAVRQRLEERGAGPVRR
ncbi:MAG: FAD-dependent oxidoreductase, partial [Planctomycetaceae bacterium]|nr:FAD-dependent oxidoreductase [Planctomycetaceae bacterium]